MLWQLKWAIFSHKINGDSYRLVLIKCKLVLQEQRRIRNYNFIKAYFIDPNNFKLNKVPIINSENKCNTAMDQTSIPYLK